MRHPYRPEPRFERLRVWTRRRRLLGLMVFVLAWIPVLSVVELTGPKSLSWFGAITLVLLLLAWNVVGWDYEEEAYRRPMRGPIRG